MTGPREAVTGPREAALALAGLAAGGAFLLTAAQLLTRNLRPTLEAREYMHDIEGATEGAQANLQALAKLERTRELSAALARRLEGLPGGSA